MAARLDPAVCQGGIDLTRIPRKAAVGVHAIRREGMRPSCPWARSGGRRMEHRDWSGKKDFCFLFSSRVPPIVLLSMRGRRLRPSLSRRSPPASRRLNEIRAARRKSSGPRTGLMISAICDVAEVPVPSRDARAVQAVGCSNDANRCSELEPRLGACLCGTCPSSC